MRLILLFSLFVTVASFLAGPSSSRDTRPSKSARPAPIALQASWNPFKEVSDIMSSLDDVIDDFVNKRMGNGEIFYGQRKYKPSGRDNTTGQYTGMGMSDKARIDAAREYKEEMMEIRRLREEGLKRD